MRLYAASFCIIFWPIGVLGSVNAAPYQAVHIWYVYQMGLSTYGVNLNPFIPDCRGSVPDKSCYFDELLKHIDGSSKKLKWKGATGIGTNLSPNVDSAAKSIKAAKYPGSIDPSKLFPGVMVKGAKGLTFDVVFGKIVQIANDLRVKVGDATLGTNLERAWWAMVNVQDARRGDMGGPVIKILNQELQKLGVTWAVETRTVEGVSGTSWTEADTEATIRAHAADVPPGGEVLRSVVTFVMGSQYHIDGPEQRHIRALVAIPGLLESLKAPLLSCPR